MKQLTLEERQKILPSVKTGVEFEEGTILIEKELNGKFVLKERHHGEWVSRDAIVIDFPDSSYYIDSNDFVDIGAV